jgi:hypothetical protein
VRSLIAAAVFIAACGGSDGAAPTTSPSPAPTDTTGGSSSSSGAGSSSSSGSPEPDASTVPATWPHSIPLTLTPTGDPDTGAAKLALDVTVGSNATFKGILDTGSNGIVAVPSAVVGATVTLDPTRKVDYVYGGALHVTGTVATAIVKLGDLTTPKPIDFVLVDSIACTPGHPNCAAAGQTVQTFKFKGNFGAIVGVGTRSVVAQHFVQSPMLQLGAPTSRFVISAQRLTIDVEPSDATTSRFAKLFAFTAGGPSPLDGVPTYDDRATPFCVNAFCGTGLLDSGGVESVGITKPADYTALGIPNGSPQIPAGTNVQFSVNGSNFTFTVGTPPTPQVDKILVAGGGALTNLGLLPFKHFDVLYDPRAGKMGLATP